jgi:hypothetical protein
MITGDSTNGFIKHGERICSRQWLGKKIIQNKPFLLTTGTPIPGVRMNGCMAIGESINGENNRGDIIMGDINRGDRIFNGRRIFKLKCCLIFIFSFNRRWEEAWGQNGNTKNCGRQNCWGEKHRGADTWLACTAKTEGKFGF